MPIHMRLDFEQPDGEARTVGSLPVEWVPVADGRFAPREILARFRGDAPKGQPQAPDLELRIEVRDGVPWCREVRVVAGDDGREVRPSDLSKVRLSEWVTDIVATFSTRVARNRDGSVSLSQPPTTDSPEFGQVVGEIGHLRRPRRKLTDEFLGQVAEVYRQHVDARNPTEKVAQAFGVAHRTAGGWLTEARGRGILPPTTKGKKQA